MNTNRRKKQCWQCIFGATLNRHRVNSTIAQPIQTSNTRISMTFSLTNLLQSLSGLLFAIVLHFLSGSGQLSTSRWTLCECVSPCQSNSMASNTHSWGPQAQWPPVVCCVFTVIVVRAFCLCQVNFISKLYFFFRHPSPMSDTFCNKSKSIFDENLWSVELTHLTGKWPDEKKNGCVIWQIVFCTPIRSISTTRR